MGHKRPGLLKGLFNLVALAPAVFNLLNNLTALINMEARLAGKNLAVVLILAVMFGSLLTATWLGVLAMLFLYLHSLNLSPFLSLFIVLLLNIILLSIVGIFMMRKKMSLFFPATRKQLRNLLGFFEKR